MDQKFKYCLKGIDSILKFYFLKLLSSIVILLIFLAVVNTGCKKKDNILIENPKPLTENEKLLTAHGWHNSLTIEDGIPHESTLWSTDDCWFFYPNHTFVNSVGAMLRPPGPGGPREENSSGTWKLDENETKLDWTTTKPYNFQLSYPVIIKSDTLIITIITPEVNRILIYVACN
jgi:hypothetical protein